MRAWVNSNIFSGPSPAAHAATYRDFGDLKKY
jgi:hypothetical protein